MTHHAPHERSTFATEQQQVPGLHLGPVSYALKAGDGIRTHDILLGKQTLCQLSYTRIQSPI